MLLAIDGIIYKYDLSTKDIIYQFKSSATRAMQLYGNDTRILAADGFNIKLWEGVSGAATGATIRPTTTFTGRGDEVPDMYSMLEVSNKIDMAASNRRGDEWYVAVVSGAEFTVFHHQLEVLFKSEVSFQLFKHF
jgi:hypothetical protein